MTSPYTDYPPDTWKEITTRLVKDFPLQPSELTEVVLTAWDELHLFPMGRSGLIIGKDIFFPAQAIGVILEAFIILDLEKRHPGIWRKGISKSEKDVVNVQKNLFSFEIKTSSSNNGIYGNRSTGHKSDKSIKTRTGYYLIVNYKLPTLAEPNHFIRKIRFGWIDDEDWVGQAKASGQQASIGSQVAKCKLLDIYSHRK